LLGHLFCSTTECPGKVVEVKVEMLEETAEQILIMKEEVCPVAEADPRLRSVALVGRWSSIELPFPMLKPTKRVELFIRLNAA
jgi:hypothetical protein